MKAVADPAWPDAATLAGWRSALPTRHPLAFWYARVTVHHVEALVDTARAVPLDGLARGFLAALGPGPAGPAELAEQLFLPRPLLSALGAQAARAGLAEAGPAGRWTLTASGRAARADGKYPAAGRERRVFHFLDRGGRGGPYLHPGSASCLPAARPAGWRFDPAVLREAIARPDTWKLRHGFPADVTGLVSQASGPDRWRAVVLALAERVVLVLALEREPGGEETLCGYGVEARTGEVLTARPALTLGTDWAEWLPGLARAASPEGWQRAWEDACVARGLARAEAAAVRVQPQGPDVNAVVSPRFRERLGPVDPWLLAGEGECRAFGRLGLGEPAGTETPSTAYPGGSGGAARSVDADPSLP